MITQEEKDLLVKAAERWPEDGGIGYFPKKWADENLADWRDASQEQRLEHG